MYEWVVVQTYLGRDRRGRRHRWTIYELCYTFEAAVVRAADIQTKWSDGAVTVVEVGV